MTSLNTTWFEVNPASKFGRDVLAQFDFKEEEIKETFDTREKFDNWPAKAAAASR